jgi:hypothetical protein
MAKASQAVQAGDLLEVLQARFEKHMERHAGLVWSTVLAKLQADQAKIHILHEMELSGGEPDLIGYDPASDQYWFVDCSPESPKGRRSLCYDLAALDARKEHKPKSSALDMAAALGIELLDEQLYRKLQTLGEFDTKTSSWLLTPAPIRELGGAIFADRRYNHVFVYHNGAESYYASRGFRGLLRV